MTGRDARNVCLFVLIGVCVAVCLQECLLRGLRRYKRGNVGIVNKMMHGDIAAGVLISGSSRACFHYDPRAIAETAGLTVYNCGRNGTRLDEQLGFLKIYLTRNALPAYVIQNLDVMSLRESNEITDPKQYIGWLGVEEIYRPLRDRKVYFLAYRWFPLLGLVRTGSMETALLGLFAPYAGAGDEFDGYRPQELAWNSDFEKFKARNEAGVRWDVSSRMVAALSELIETCRRRGIRIILVFSPEYFESQKYIMSRDEIFAAFTRIAERYAVPFWDYSADPMCYEQRLFYNSQHMNATGAALFSRSLGQRISTEVSKERLAKAERGRMP
jgi:hypothetical protein